MYLLAGACTLYTLRNAFGFLDLVQHVKKYMYLYQLMLHSQVCTEDIAIGYKWNVSMNYAASASVFLMDRILMKRRRKKRAEIVTQKAILATYL